MNKKAFNAIMCIMLCAAFLLAGCGKQADAQPDETQADNAADVEQVLKVGIGTDINTWDITAFPEGDGRFVWSQIYETLVRLDTELNMVAGLAESWESEEDGKVWIFNLRQDVKFHDGTPFNADAVVFSYGDSSYVAKTKTLQLESVEAIDDYTVKFTCTKAIPLPTYLTHIAWPIVSPSCVDSAGEFTQPIGTGPFKFVSYSKGEEVVLKKNDDYWGDAAKLDQVVFKIIPDATSRMLAIRSGDIDMCLKVPESDVSALEEEGITVNRKLSTFTDFLQFNCAKAPFDDVNVRKAVANAIDTEGIVDNILNNIGVAAKGRPFSPAMMYSSEDLSLYSQDQEKAKSLLAESGWKDDDNDGILEKDGEKLTVSLLVGQFWSARELKIVQACQAQLEEVGFDVEIKQLESAALSDLENSGDFDMIMRTGYFVWGPYPHHVKIHFSKNFASHYNNPSYDELVIKGESVNDEVEKQQIYEDLEKMILDDLPAFYIVHEEKIVATRDNVQGYEISAEDPWLELKGVSLS